MKKIVAGLSLIAMVGSSPLRAVLDGQGPCGSPTAACCCSAPKKAAFAVGKFAIDAATRNGDPATAVVATAATIGILWYRAQIAQGAQVIYMGARLYPKQALLSLVALGLIVEATYRYWSNDVAAFRQA